MQSTEGETRRGGRSTLKQVRRGEGTVSRNTMYMKDAF